MFMLEHIIDVYAYGLCIRFMHTVYGGTAGEISIFRLRIYALA
jgi:hypothetical protein